MRAARARLSRLQLIGVPLVIAWVLGSMVMPAEAHWADLAVADIVVEARQVRMVLTFPTGLVAGTDDDRDGTLSPEEMRRHRNELATALEERIRMTSAEESGHLAVRPAGRVALPRDVPAGTRSHSSLLLVYTWAVPVRELAVRYDLFFPGLATSSCLATITHAGTTQTVVFTPAHREFYLDARPAYQQLRSFVTLGAEHIFTGYDHILFLLSLLMAGTRLRPLLKVVTAFTAAHSVTLSLAVLNVVSLPGRWVESGIALSIIYVALQNIWRQGPGRDRWLVTFGFGLVHGLGFASILREMALSANLPLALAGFNLGVEFGQAVIVAGAFLILRLLERAPWAPMLRRVVSGAAAMVGAVWLVQRTLLGA